jgi:hypothetical protein
MSNQDDAWNEEIKELLLQVSAEDSPPEGASARILERVEDSLAKPPATAGGQEASAAAKSSLNAWTTLAFAVAGITAVLVASEPEDEPPAVVAQHAIKAHSMPTTPFNEIEAKTPTPLPKKEPAKESVQEPSPSVAAESREVPAEAVGTDAQPEGDALPPKLNPPSKKTLDGPDGPRTDLRAEQALLEKARVAIESGRLSRAWKHLRGHARRFPKGVLVEEREGLWVRGLVRSGRKKRAAKRAKRFLKRFPRSSQRRMVEKALID